MAKGIKWAEAKHTYVTTEASLAEIAHKFGTSESQVRKRAAAEKWTDERNRVRTETEQKTTEKTIELVSDDRAQINAAHYAIWGEVIGKLKAALLTALELDEIDTLTKALERAQKGQRLAKDMVTDRTSTETTGAEAASVVMVVPPDSEDWARLMAVKNGDESSMEP